jgi:hypothetical protein
MFTDGVANRSARLAIDLFAVVGDSTNHDGFRFVSIHMLDKSLVGELFPVTKRLMPIGEN